MSCHGAALEDARGPSLASRVAGRVEGLVIRRPRLIPRLQLVMAAFYLLLILLPPFLPAPQPGATALTDFVCFSRFVIWSIWWPFVLLSLLVLGRAWCGVFCPEGAMAQAASRFGRNHRIPRLLTWGGTPLLAFVAITVVGQLMEVDRYPTPQLVVLGGSTALAIVTALVFTRHSRVWCRHLCPVSLLFGVFSRLGAATFHVDRQRLESSLASSPCQKGRCPVLIHLPAMSTARDCLMCFQCAGWRDAIHLRIRRPGEELERIDRAQPMFWEVMFLFGGAIGLPLGVLFAERLELQGLQLVGSLVGGTVLAVMVLSLLTAMSVMLLRDGGSVWRLRFMALSYAYAPLGLFSLFLGLSQPTFESAVAIGVPGQLVLTLRTVLLLAGATWGCLTSVRMLRLTGLRPWRLRLASLPFLTGTVAVAAAWARVLSSG